MTREDLRELYKKDKNKIVSPDNFQNVVNYMEWLEDKIIKIDYEYMNLEDIL